MHRILLYLLLLAACQSPSPPPQPARTSDVASATGGRFQFSAAPPEAGLRDAGNLCTHSFHEAIRLDAAADNANRRMFTLGSGMHRVAVSLGGQTASFMLKKSAGQAIEVFTSVNFPLCLSDRAKFTPDAGNNSLRFNNRQGISFIVEGVEQTNGIVVVLEIPTGTGYGLQVHRCEDCQ